MSSDLKFVLVGHHGVGKTSLISQYVDDVFDPESYPCIGHDFRTKMICVEGENVKLQIWEARGGERFKGLAPSYYRGSSAVILVFDTSVRNTFDDLAGFQEAMNYCIKDPNTLRVFLANKLDKERVVKQGEGERYAVEHGMLYFESSAKTGEGVKEVFEGTAAEIKQTPELWETVLRSDKAHTQEREKRMCCLC